MKKFIFSTAFVLGTVACSGDPAPRDLESNDQAQTIEQNSDNAVADISPVTEKPMLPDTQIPATTLSEAELNDIFYSADLSEVEAILAKGLGVSIEDLLKEENPLDSLVDKGLGDIKSSLIFSFKEDLASCLEVYEDFSKHEMMIKSLLASFNVETINIGSFGKEFLAALKTQLIAKSGFLMSALASKRGDADKCFASLKDFYGKIDIDGLLKVYLPKLDPLKEAGLEVVKSLDCNAESEAPALTCVTNKDIACKAKSLLESKDYLGAKSLVLKLDFEKMSSCFEENVKAY